MRRKHEMEMETMVYLAESRLLESALGHLLKHVYVI
jgi:hypothetical protein